VDDRLLKEASYPIVRLKVFHLFLPYLPRPHLFKVSKPDRERPENPQWCSSALNCGLISAAEATFH
jgi:hypothetical protein